MPVTTCERFCASPCAELSFEAIPFECGSCSSQHACHPGAVGWPRERRRKTNGRFTLGPQREALCERLVSYHFCDQYAEDMRTFCHEDPVSCHPQTWSSNSRGLRCGGSALCDERRITWTKASVFDSIVARNISRCPKTPARHLDRGHWCEDLENPRRIKDRGFFVVRGMTPPSELEEMRRFVAELPAGARLHCGLSGLQPRECFRNPSEAAMLMPTTHRRLNQVFARWLRSDFHETAQLGWPLKPEGGEFIAINQWRHAQNVSCIMQALFNTATERGASERAQRRGTYWSCVRECPAQGAVTSVCYAWCVWDIVQARLAVSEVIQIVRVAASASSCAPVPPRHTLIPDPMMLVAGDAMKEAFQQVHAEALPGWFKFSMALWTRIDRVPS